jgi:hypothetical protein
VFLPTPVFLVHIHVASILVIFRYDPCRPWPGRFPVSVSFNPNPDPDPDCTFLRVVFFTDRRPRDNGTTVG